MTTEEGISYFNNSVFKGYDQMRILQAWVEYRTYCDMLAILYRHRVNDTFSHIDWTETCNHFSMLKHIRMRSMVEMLQRHFENEYKYSKVCDKLFGKGGWGKGSV